MPEYLDYFTKTGLNYSEYTKHLNYLAIKVLSLGVELPLGGVTSPEGQVRVAYRSKQTFCEAKFIVGRVAVLQIGFKGDSF